MDCMVEYQLIMEDVFKEDAFGAVHLGAIAGIGAVCVDSYEREELRCSKA